ncbi:MAG: amidohydrolase family protein [Planctomycetes bacterium]|nr:amidohydrolase family protein [Planctomycetota bacterium]
MGTTMFRRPQRWFAGAVATAALAAAAAAQAPAPGPVPARNFAVRCGTLLVGDGSTVLHDAWLVVVDGKIRSVGKDTPPADLPIVDAADKVVMPGIVAVDSDLAAAADSDYQLTPDALAIDSFAFDRKWLSALEGGVTTAYLSPGRERLVSGQGAVVKLAGTDLVARILDENACLRVNFADGAMLAPRVFEPTAHPTDDDPLLPARIQTPTSRISVLAELRAAFAAATDADRRPGGQGQAENRYDEAPLAAVVAGKLAVRAGAARAQDIRRALELQQELGLHMVLEDPQQIEELAALAAQQKVAATFRVPVLLGRSNPGGEDRLQETLPPRFDAPAKAAAAGVLIGVGPAAGVPLRDYLMSVAVAVGNGLPGTTALRAIGLDAARILGVDHRVGTLAAGKDADFLVLSGEPLAVGTMVEATWIDGERAFARKTASRVLAVRVGRVHDGHGRVFRHGVVLMQDGRIKAVGEDLAIPYGAEVIDLPDAVATPGLIDAFSHLGLAGEGTPVPFGQPGQQLDAAIAHDDPMFAAALAEGITTLFVSGKDGGTMNGRVTAVKTGARDHDAMVVRPIVALRLAHDTIGPDAIKSFVDTLNRGKQYVETWRKFEKELAEFEQGKKPTAAPTAEAPKSEPASPEAAAKEDPIGGVWEAELDVQGQIRLKVTLELQLEGTKVTGTITIAFGERQLPAQPIASGSFENGTLKLEFRGMGGSATLEAKVTGDRLEGKLSLGRMGDQDVTGTRTSKTAGAPAKKPTARKTADESGRPKAPKVDQNLEPLRAAIEKRAALVVRSNRATAIRDVVELLEKEQIPYVLQGVEDLLDDASLLQGKKPPVLLGPDVVRDDDGELIDVAAVLADQDLPVVLGSGDCAGARFLPLHAAYAVRYGFSPQDALAALTSASAKAFRVDDRVGSLAKGKDADLVVFSGNPFEPQSRVLLVVCNGEIVVDHREGKK